MLYLFWIFFVLISLFGLTACGFKGPLSLPPEEKPFQHLKS